MSKFHFVFLQGMPCPFFSRVGQSLSRDGHRVTRINLCVGDWLFWHGSETLSYRGKYSEWSKFLGKFFQSSGVTDLVLLGEQRKYHKEAVAVAQGMGVRVTVTDFGYLRPDWITLEPDGMGGNSKFSRDPEAILQQARQLPKADLARRYSDSSLQMAFGDLLYSFSNVFLGWLYPYYQRSEARPHPLIYFPAIGRRLLFAEKSRLRAVQRMQAVIASGVKYFVFPLQLEHDFQIVAYSPFSGLDEVIALVIGSFSRYADKDCRLVIKAHPWEPGLKNWESRVNALARAAGVVDRVDYLDGGDLDEMTVRSQGVVTVNSTAGLRALQLGASVKVLGSAIYDMPRLTFQGKLDDFWINREAPDSELVDAFVNVMAATIQIRGVFFSEPGCTAAVNAAVRYLSTRRPSLA